MGEKEDVDFGALSEEAWRKQEAEDELVIAGALDTGNQSFGNGDNPLDALVSNVWNGEIDQQGKADDAVDFEDMDLSDDELPDEEEAGQGAANGRLTPDAQDDSNDRRSSGDIPGLTDDGGTSNDTDDLFGGDPHEHASSPLLRGAPASSPRLDDPDAEDQFHLQMSAGETMEDLMRLNFGHDTGPTSANQDPNIPEAPENLLEIVKQAYPKFQERTILPWNDVVPVKEQHWISKKPLKPPKSLVPSKLSLELDVDQEKLFRIAGPATSSVWQKLKDAETRGLVCLEEPEAFERADLEAFSLDVDSDSEVIGGFTLRDIITVCDDFDSAVGLDSDDAPGAEPAVNSKYGKETSDDDADWDEMFLDEPHAKRRRTAPPKGLPEIPNLAAPNFDNFEAATAKLGKRVVLDMNDPYLLIDDLDSERATKRRKVQHKMVRMANGRMGQELTQRFNSSNDLAYDALKENHSNKIRATLAPVPVDHSMPALRLAWPYYTVKLAASDPHSYHRPQLRTRKEAFSSIRFKQPAITKRKALKGKRVNEIFKESKDLGMNDNSTAVLFEYCEEIPTVLSNFGMGQRIINYYRRNKGSETRPEKRDLGDTCILLPEDRSPFAIFGQVNPGEVVPTLHNSMFRAPIFKHNSRDTDFIIGRSTTGQSGSSWYMRNIDHVYVVGQNLPLSEVPGPHSRRVTNIAKNRLKMVSYRLLRKSEHVTLHDITRHVADSNESQNRQKLKEFLRFRKDTKDWALPEGEEMMDEAGIRNLVKPEDVCLLDAMQVGAHELENGGYEVSGDVLKVDDMLDDDELPPDAIANKMVPWKTTKSFIDASHGKAMLAVHGPGDPTGKGLGISFLKTSMKGGYLEQLQGPLATSADAIEKQRKANGGHMYNVKNQDQLYTEALNNIWTRQRESLEDATAHDDEDVLAQEDEDDRFNVQSQVAATPVHEGMSQVSRSAASAMNRKKLKITREVKNENGEIVKVTEIVHDPVVITQYIKKRRQQDIDEIDIYNAQLTGDAERDQLILQLAEKEADRLAKNKERTHKREKQKKMLAKSGGGGADDGSPEPTTEKATGTTRKCANCGQVGHIKTNKKLCPLLNGTIQKDQSQGESAGLGSLNAPVAASFLGGD
ncbi:hypothetical protein GQ53DRAFT_634464 [Thozetella sp. PMI_491]|nr:hypothetical protein GQ53DRAFT_634464 [Thozetella sp. PMI_491]